MPSLQDSHIVLLFIIEVYTQLGIPLLAHYPDLTSYPGAHFKQFNPI